MYSSVLSFLLKSDNVNNHMDQPLTWNLHVNHIVAKQSRTIALVRRHAWAMSYEVCKVVIRALVLSVAQYCLPAIANMSESKTRKLQVVQNRAFRLLLKCSLNAPFEQMHLDLGWPMLRDRDRKSVV